MGFFARFTTIVYIQLRPEQIIIRHIPRGKESREVAGEPLVAIVEHPKRGKVVVSVGSEARSCLPELTTDETLHLGNGFKHPRSIIGDVELAEIALKHFFKQVIQANRLLVSPDCFMHVLGDWEGRLTPGEQLILRQLGLSIGCRFVWTLKPSQPLMDEQLWEIYRNPKLAEKFLHQN